MAEDWAWPALIQSLQRDIEHPRGAVDDLRRETVQSRERHRDELDGLIDQLRAVRSELDPILSERAGARKAKRDMLWDWVGKHVCFKDTEVLPKLWINVWMSQSINGIVYVWRLGWPGLLRTCSSSGRCASPFFLVSPILGTRRFDGRLVDVSVSSVGCVDVFEVWDM